MADRTTSPQTTGCGRRWASSVVLGAALFAAGMPTQSAQAQNVLVLGTPSIWVWDDDIQAVLGLDGRITGEIVVREVEGITPTADDLEGFDAVITYTENPYHDADALGDLLADFVDQGGGVVVMAHAFSAGKAIGGRLASGGYLPFTTNGVDSGKSGPMEMRRLPDPAGIHEIFVNVVRVYGGPGSYHSTGITATPGVKVLAEWESGDVFAAVKEAGSGRVVGLNMFPPSNLFGPQYPAARDNWDFVSFPPNADPILTTHAGQLMVSSVLWATGNTSTCFNSTIIQDLNCNGIDVSFEGPLDPLYPMCDTADVTRNQDWYFDYYRFGCEHDVAGNDADNDLLGGTPVQLFPTDLSPFPDFVGPTCDNCPENYNPDQRDVECDGSGDLCDLCPTIQQMQNQDGDGAADECDNCVRVGNDDQLDGDYDIVGNACDNCVDVYNPDQADGGDTAVPDDDGENEVEERGQPDGVGNICDNCVNDYNPSQSDADADMIGDDCDNCPFAPNVDQRNSDADPLGDACDPCPFDSRFEPKDRDSDGVGDRCDRCPNDADPLQTDVDGDSIGDACDNCPLTSGSQVDADGDEIGDVCDVCPSVPDAEQPDADGDGTGDACDVCPALLDPDQFDGDGDGAGDLCDVCNNLFNPVQEDRDGDAIGDECDNCPSVSNASQADADLDGIGDNCDYQARGGGAEVSCATGSTTPAWSLAALAGAMLLRRRARR